MVSNTAFKIPVRKKRVNTHTYTRTLTSTCTHTHGHKHTRTHTHIQYYKLLDLILHACVYEHINLLHYFMFWFILIPVRKKRVNRKTSLQYKFGTVLELSRPTQRAAKRLVE